MDSRERSTSAKPIATHSARRNAVKSQIVQRNVASRHPGDQGERRAKVSGNAVAVFEDELLFMRSFHLARIL